MSNESNNYNETFTKHLELIQSAMKKFEEENCYYTYFGTFLSKTEWPLYSILIALEIALSILIYK